MSEKKEWKDEMREIVREELEKVIPSSKPSEEGHKTHGSLTELLDCPDCYPPLRAGVIEKEFKDAKFECTECNLPVKKEESGKEEWKCPRCENRYARPKQR